MLTAMATGAAPIVMVTHLAKGLAKWSSWGQFLPYALKDPKGVETFRAIVIENTLAMPERLAPLFPLGLLMLALLAFITVKSWRWVKISTPGDLAAARAGLVVPSLLYGAIIVAWIMN